MEPCVWGPSLWNSIHYIALAYPDAPSETDKKAYFEFYRDLYRVLPCEVCSKHYQAHWADQGLRPEDLVSADTLFAWTVRLHNLVNRDLGKNEWSLEKARTHYRRARCGRQYLSEFGAGLVVGGLIGWFVYKRWFGGGKR